MRPFLALLLGITCVLLVTPVAFAGTCALPRPFAEPSLSQVRLPPPPICDKTTFTAPMPNTKVVGAGIIYLYANDEAKYSSLNNVLHAVNQLEGKYIYPGETFSFNQAANLLQEDIPYDLGPDVRNNLVKAGGVCMVSSLIATAAHDAGLPFVNERGKIIPQPLPHSRYYRYYHQVNVLNNRVVPIVEAAVAIQKNYLGQPWETVQDMQFINNTGRILVLHFEPSFTVDDLNLSEPFGLIQKNQTFKVELRAVPTGLDVWLSSLERFSLN